MASTVGNGAQIEHWNGPAGQKWVTLQTRLDAQLAPLGRVAMERAAIQKGFKILDVGCGNGQTSLELAERTGPGGSVLGIDISRPMLARAEERRSSAGVTNLRFQEADAQAHSFTARGFDLAFSRFGVMFFSDPAAAFGNVRSVLRQGGGLAFVCWRKRQDNQWVEVPLAAARAHIELPPPAEPGAPGQFAFAERERVESILRQAGFVEIAVEPYDTLIGGASLDVAVDTALQMGPLGAALREAPLAEKRDVVAGVVKEALAPFDGAQGVRLGAAIWVVSARAP